MIKKQFLSLILLCVVFFAFAAMADTERSHAHTNQHIKPHAKPQATQQTIQNTIKKTIETKTTETNDSAQPKQIITESTLSAGDLLQVYVFGVDDLSGDFRIDDKGVLTLPLIGGTPAAGLTKKQLEETITTRLITEGYYNDPKVTIEVSAMQPFYILGEVKTPGSYPFTPDLDVFKAIATAGGYTPRAKKETIIIIRKINGQKTHINATEDTPILPGDSIKVEQRFF